MYPVMLDVKDRLCLVVGGGGVAVRKVQGLRTEGAQITVVALEPADTLVQLSERRLITLKKREYRDGEARDYALVFAATDDRATNQRVFDDARAADIWVNVADDPEFCSFHLPARVQRGPLQLAIASHGEAPFVVRRLRQALEQRFGPEWAEWLEAAARFRQEVRTSDLSQPDRERAYDQFFSLTVDARRLTARVPTDDEVAQWLTGTAPSATKPEPRDNAPLLQRGGFVSLIGGGPGDAGLLTVKGRQRLLAADAVAYDRLAATALPCEIGPEVELHCVGKTAGNHPVPQEQITALLIRLARQGKHVARLKGGDPFVFGRGGEEAEALAAAGIPFEVIPSVTAGIAVPAYAGIPVTHRKEVVRVTMVTAHEAAKRGGPQVRWDQLADPHATILGYMGVTSLPKVVSELLASAIDPKTPAAMIERGTTCRQRTVRAPLDELPAAVKESGLKPPALFVIGPAVRHADTLQWFTTRPLFGHRIGIFNCHDADSSKKLVEALQLNGAETVCTPQPVTPAARVVIGSLPLTGWVLRDAGEVDAVEDERGGPGWGPEVIAWCLTPEAAARARELRWERVEQADASALLEAIRSR